MNSRQYVTKPAWEVCKVESGSRKNSTSPMCKTILTTKELTHIDQRCSIILLRLKKLRNIAALKVPSKTYQPIHNVRILSHFCFYTSFTLIC